MKDLTGNTSLFNFNLTLFDVHPAMSYTLLLRIFFISSVSPLIPNLL